MNRDWNSQASELGEAIASSITARMERRELADRLSELVFTSARQSSAEISLLVSADEVIVAAGRGTRFELDPLPESSAEVQRIVGAISRGGLTEVVGPRSVRFELRLDDGSRLTGRSRGIRTGLSGRQTIHYPAFAADA